MAQLTPFQQAIADINNDKPVIVLITKTNCPPCERAKPVFNEVKASLDSVAKFYEINVVDLPTDFIQSRRLVSAPTCLMYRFGLEEHRLVGEQVQYGLQNAATHFVKTFLEQNSGGSTSDNLFEDVTL